jgi:hypothetical protein
MTAAGSPVVDAIEACVARSFPDVHSAFLEQAIEAVAPRRVLDVDDLRPRRS